MGIILQTGLGVGGREKLIISMLIRSGQSPAGKPLSLVSLPTKVVTGLWNLHLALPTGGCKCPVGVSYELSGLTAEQKGTGLLKSSKLKACLNCDVWTASGIYFLWICKIKLAGRVGATGRKAGSRISANGGPHWNSFQHTPGCGRELSKKSHLLRHILGEGGVGSSI